MSIPNAERVSERRSDEYHQEWKCLDTINCKASVALAGDHCVTRHDLVNRHCMNQDPPQ
jgi:hypothetical protein